MFETQLRKYNVAITSFLFGKKKEVRKSLCGSTRNVFFVGLCLPQNLTKLNQLHTPRKQTCFTALGEDSTKENTTFLIYRERWSIFSKVTTYQKHPDLCLLVLVERAAQFLSWHCLCTVPLGRICLTLTRTEWVKQKQQGDEYKAFHCPHYISFLCV